ncbi:MAG: hypothetical protein U0350_24025 [Caldilineaceae bacterium]
MSAWSNEQLKAGLLPHEIGVFVRSTTELERAQAAVQQAGIPFKVLNEKAETMKSSPSGAHRNRG